MNICSSTTTVPPCSHLSAQVKVPVSVSLSIDFLHRILKLSFFHASLNSIFTPEQNSRVMFCLVPHFRTTLYLTRISTMSFVPGSLHDVLTQPNPPLTPKGKIAGSSSYQDFVELTPEDISVCKALPSAAHSPMFPDSLVLGAPRLTFDFADALGQDFNITNIMAWHHLLGRPYQGPLISQDVVSDSQRLIGNEEKVDDVALQWNVRVLKGPLRAAAPYIIKDDPSKLTVGKRDCTFKNPLKRGTSRKNDLKPVMTVHINPKNNSPGPVKMLVMGDNKYSGACDFQQSWAVIRNKGRKNMDWSIRPFRQVATYCMVGETRYVYVMSDKELLALRVFCNTDQTGVNHWSMEVGHPIPWDAQGSRELTVNLAIWWLGVMAMNAPG